MVYLDKDHPQRGAWESLTPDTRLSVETNGKDIYIKVIAERERLGVFISRIIKSLKADRAPLLERLQQLAEYPTTSPAQATAVERSKSYILKHIERNRNTARQLGEFLHSNV